MSKLKLNLGSGQRKFKCGDGWVNIDTQSRWEPDIVADCSDLSHLYPNSSVGLIVLHHVLEHFGCGEGDALLRECYRLLDPQGSLLVFVPNMWELTSMWREGRIDAQIYMTNVYGAYMGDEADRHRWGYDTNSLRRTLKVNGFSQTWLFDGRRIEGADIAQDRWILGMEALK